MRSPKEHQKSVADDNDAQLSDIRLVTDWIRREYVNDQSRQSKLSAAADTISKTVGFEEFDIAFEEAVFASSVHAADEPLTEAWALMLSSILEEAARELSCADPSDHDFWDTIRHFAASAGELPPNHAIVRSCLQELGKYPVPSARDDILKVFERAGDHAMVAYLLNPRK